VREVSAAAGVARTDGSPADGAAFPRRAAAAHFDRARAEMGRLAPTEILIWCDETGIRRLPVKGCSFKLCPFRDLNRARFRPFPNVGAAMEEKMQESIIPLIQ